MMVDEDIEGAERFHPAPCGWWPEYQKSPLAVSRHRRTALSHRNADEHVVTRMGADRDAEAAQLVQHREVDPRHHSKQKDVLVECFRRKARRDGRRKTESRTAGPPGSRGQSRQVEQAQARKAVPSRGPAGIALPRRCPPRQKSPPGQCPRRSGRGRSVPRRPPPGTAQARDSGPTSARANATLSSAIPRQTPERSSGRSSQRSHVQIRKTPTIRPAANKAGAGRKHRGPSAARCRPHCAGPPHGCRRPRGRCLRRPAEGHQEHQARPGMAGRIPIADLAAGDQVMAARQRAAEQGEGEYQGAG